MQYLPVDPIIEQTVLYTGAVFAAVVLLGVYYYSGDSRYRRWALSQLAFWTAFLPPSLFNGVPLIGDFLGMLLEVLGSVILLRAFNFRRFSKASNRLIYSVFLVILISLWLPVVLFTAPLSVPAIPSTLIMIYAFAYVARTILNEKENRNKIWISAGWSYILWFFASIPLVLFPMVPGVVLARYIQSLAQLGVTITLFISFIDNNKQRIQGNLKLATISGSLLSHDLRNYLNVAQGAIDLVNASDDDSKEMIATATRSLHSAVTFMQQTHGLWTELGSGPAYLTDIDLQSIVKEVVARAKQEHTLREGQISIELSERCYISSSNLIGQVIWNIIDNSIEHAKSEPMIHIKLFADRSIVLSIADWSGGISQEQKERIMSKKSNPAGLGIGLMLVREISHIYGIPIRVEDNVEDGVPVGTVFTMSFPYSGGVPSRKH